MGTKHNSFSLRFAYHMERSHRESEKKGMLFDCSYEISVETDLETSFPLVLKQFIWMVCHEILPTKVNLFKRCIGHDQLCPMCLRESKTVCHVLWDCFAAIAVWQECPKHLQILSLVARDSHSIV